NITAGTTTSVRRWRNSFPQRLTSEPRIQPQCAYQSSQSIQHSLVGTKNYFRRERLNTPVVCALVKKPTNSLFVARPTQSNSPPSCGPRSTVPLKRTAPPARRPSILIVYLYGRPQSPSKVASQIASFLATFATSSLQISRAGTAPCAGLHVDHVPAHSPSICG